MARKRAANGSGLQPRKRPDGRWEVRFSTGINPATGRKIIKCLYGKTSSEVAEKLRCSTAEVDQGDYLEPSKLIVSQWMNIWLTEYAGHLAASTRKTYQDYAKDHITPAIGGLRISQIQPHQIQHFLNSLEGKGRKSGQKLAYGTKKRIRNCLSGAFNKAKELKYIKENPVSATTVACDEDEESSRTINPFTTEELASFLAAAKGSRFEDVFCVAVNTGMRLSEILGLRYSRFNESKARITVNCQLLCQREKGVPRKLGPTKSKRSRSFKVAPSVVALLRHQRKLQKENRLKAGSAWDPDIPDLIFTNEIGKSIPHVSVEREFKKIVTAIGCPEHRFHDLRHTFATLALQNGANLKTLSAALGHHSVAFTLDVYGHVSDEMSDSFAALMEEIIAAR